MFGRLLFVGGFATAEATQARQGAPEEITDRSSSIPLVVDSLDDGKNSPLPIRPRKRHVVNPMWSNEFGGSDVSRDVQHAYLFCPLCLG